jgi:uncharacterized protein YqeY
MRARLSNDTKEAMKAKDTRRLSTLRMISAAIKDRDIAVRPEGRTAISDDEILQLLAKMAKQRGESIAMYETGGRPDLVAQEREEQAIIESYMPKQMSAEEMRAAIAKVIGELGVSGMKEMGKTIAELKSRYAGQMDFAKASAIVKELLTAAA